MSRLYSIYKYIEHRFSSRRWDSFHSPFLFGLFSHCCNDKIDFPEFAFIESRRRSFLRSTESIKRTDYGAGMTNLKVSTHKRISLIARQSLSLPFQCRFLYRLMKLTNPKTCLEFGTSLGITTSYLAIGAETGKIITVEGDPVIASMARKLFADLNIKNITTSDTTFEAFLENELKENETIDFLFLDGNHKSSPLINYYESLKSHFSPQTIVMVDDIYWSADMHAGWTSLIEKPEVTQSVDCFQFGLIFFNPGFMDKEHHLIRLPIASFRH